MHMARQTPAAAPLLTLLLAVVAAVAPAPISAQLSGAEARAQLQAVTSGAVQMNGVNLGGWLVMEDWCDPRTAMSGASYLRLRCKAALVGSSELSQQYGSSL